MVSFSCDGCQEVKTKPKALAHFASCRECSTMSCIDCGVTFTRRTIGPHTSCISEAAKYGPRPATSGARNTQGFCADCNLALNGAVASLQHYESKKHKATLRRKKAEQRAKKQATTDSKAVDPASGQDQPKPVDDMASPTSASIDTPLPSTGSITKQNDAAPIQKAKCSKETSLLKAKELGVGKHGLGKHGVKKAMICSLSAVMGSKLKMDKLKLAVKKLLGPDAPDDVGRKVEKRAGKAPFGLKKSKVYLIE